MAKKGKCIYCWTPWKKCWKGLGACCKKCSHPTQAPKEERA